MPITKFRDLESVPPPPALDTPAENLRLAFELSELALALGRAGAASYAPTRRASKPAKTGAATPRRRAAGPTAAKAREETQS